MTIINSDNIPEAKRLTEKLHQHLATFTAEMNKLSNRPIKSITYHVHTGESMEETNLKIVYLNMPFV